MAGLGEVRVCISAHVNNLCMSVATCGHVSVLVCGCAPMHMLPHMNAFTCVCSCIGMSAVCMGVSVCMHAHAQGQAAAVKRLLVAAAATAGSYHSSFGN